VIYDSNCNDSFIYDLTRFVNKITFIHELIDIFNDLMMIEKYEIMFMINHINNKNRKIFFENIAYMLFINVILIFIIHFKKQNFIWNMYKEILINKLIDVIIYDIKKKHDLFFFEISINQKIR
jgi:hypothetical protein